MKKGLKIALGIIGGIAAVYAVIGFASAKFRLSYRCGTNSCFFIGANSDDMEKYPLSKLWPSPSLAQYANLFLVPV